MTAENKPNLLLIIKAKIRGEALAQVSPLDRYIVWTELKKHIRNKIKKPVTYEFAQEDLNEISQNSSESMEDYGKRMKEKLRKFNEASRLMTETQAEIAILQKANEKFAIAKFEQNICDSTVRVLVSATTKSSLDEAIQIALQKELMEKNKNIKTCTYCGLSNHTQDQCRKRKLNNENRIKNFKNSFGTHKNENNESSKNGSTSGEQSKFKKPNNGQQKYESNNNNNGSKFQKNVRTVEHELDSMTLQDALEIEEEEFESKNE